MTYVLLTRAPLYWGRSPFSRDLHVLGAPLTFVLSQDQTLQFESLGETPWSKPPCLPLCSLSFESADLRSPKRSLRSRLVTRTHDIFIAGNRIQFSRTEGKFPSERVAVFSLFGLCCQRLFETLFSPFLLLTSLCGAFRLCFESLKRVAVLSLSCRVRQGLSETFFSPLLLRAFFSLLFSGASGVRSGSRYLVSGVFAVKDFEKLSSATPRLETSCGCALRRGVGGVRSGRRCMLPLPLLGQVLLSLSFVFQKTSDFLRVSAA